MKFVENCLMKSWWVVLFILTCYMFYEQGLKKRDQDFDKLHLQLVDLQKQKKEALSLREDLILQVNSQSDPAWVELVLMKGLGLIPEGQTKVFFTNKEL
jgi:hypothetical protein